MTRKSILVIALTLIVYHAFSKCRPAALQVWPPRGIITTNSVFILSLVRKAQEYSGKFQKKNTIYLKEFNSAVKIALLSAESYKGEFEVTQIFYRPETPLKNGGIYYLYIPSLSEDELDELAFTDNFDNDRGEFFSTYIKDAIWQVCGTDSLAPTSLGTPAFDHNSYRRFGCGPVVNTYFTPNFKDSGLIAYKVTLTRTDTLLPAITGWTTDYDLLDVDDDIDADTPAIVNTAAPSNQLAIGFGMCAGMFRLEYSKHYKATIQAMDASGNLCAVTREIEFTSPSLDTD